VLRALTLLAALVCGVVLSACESGDKTDPDAARAQRQEAASRAREQRIAQLERRLARLKALDEATGGARGSARLSPAFGRFEASLTGSAAGDPPLRVATPHWGYPRTVFTFFADAVLIRPFIAELAHAETAPL
jgi:hypothetical protein